MLEQLSGQSIYFDTNPFIYFVEGHDVFYDAVRPVFAVVNNGEADAVTSQLTLTELLIKPYRDGLADVVTAYEGLLLASGCFSVVGLTQATFLKAAQLGGALRLRTPDALHFAVALENKCDYFITNDKRIRSYGGVEVIQVADLIVE